jgi:hypothetical protein
MSTTGSTDDALNASIQKCPAMDVIATHSAPAAAKRLVSLIKMATWVAAALLARLPRSVGVSACTIVSSSGAFLLANVEIKRR